ncbi:uncharacterized protein A4U43_C03F15680 [Asparagus officinalis]|uniref:Uncharacterized protein n=1 Tax=Asparagus officinalis TaxID=4686 RepID=A0A5P1FAB6_ASPOF|nr:kinesin light chain 3 isoform X2 [Asparagus officinalis]ONK75326.1 uncharacterized protein A4U43_C03F15680 [Asparagus officinalis]
MASIQRALSFIRRFRPRPQFATAARSSPLNDSSASFLSTVGLSRRGSNSSASKHRWDPISALVFAGPTAVFVGLGVNTAYAETASDAEPIAATEQGEAYVTGLRRIEDGSVVSNSHTIKWRIFTDKGRELFLKGKIDEAEKFLRSAIDEAKEGFGPRDPHVASSYNNLAEFYRVRKAFEKAEPLYLEAISILEEAFGSDDVRVGAALHNLGQFYLAQRKLEQAQKCYERALKIEGRVLGYGHPDYANTMYHLGMVLHLLGKVKDSETIVEESIKILEEGGLGETTTCIRRMRYLSQMFLSSNRAVEAEKLQRKILHILELSKGWESLDTIVAAEGLALTLQSLGSLSEARDLLERCLEARKKILPHDHIQVAANMLHLGRVAMHKSNHLRKVNISEARGELDKAKTFVDNSIRIAKTVLNCASKNYNSLQSSDNSNGSAKDQHRALVILLQSMDLAGLLDIAKCELLEKGEKNFIFDAELSLRECIAMFKEPRIRCLLNSPDVKSEYLSCLKHLTTMVNENIDGNNERSTALKELRDEALHVEAELSPRRRN